MSYLEVNSPKLIAVNEIDWINALKEGDNNAFRAIVYRYQQTIYKTCIGLIRDEVLAQDLTQEVFIELHKSIQNFRGESKLSTWLYRVAINKSLNHLRDNKKHQILKSIQTFFFIDKMDNNALVLKDVKSDNPLRIMENAETRNVLQAAIDQLPANQKTAFVLKNLDDLSYKEIAEVMDTSLSSVESLIHRARLNLQKSLAQFYKENIL